MRPSSLPCLAGFFDGGLVLDRGDVAGLAPSTTAFSTRRMILPLRVLGSMSTMLTSPITATHGRGRNQGEDSGDGQARQVLWGKCGWCSFLDGSITRGRGHRVWKRGHASRAGVFLS